MFEMRSSNRHVLSAKFDQQWLLLISKSPLDTVAKAQKEDSHGCAHTQKMH